MSSSFYLDKDQVFSDAGLAHSEFEKTGMTWSEVSQVCEHHAAQTVDLLTTGTYIVSRLQTLPAVHSLKVRVKDPHHLASKIVRKKHEDPNRCLGLTDYQTTVTDLVGIRALHLFKEQWKPIHEFVMATWEQRETPTAYVRKGDPETLSAGFATAGCSVKEHPFGYRSVHYLLRSLPSKIERVVELQVRTIFEEGWSEIDHHVRYPRQSNDQYLGDLLRIFNRLAGSADEIGTFIRSLSEYLSNHRDRLAERDAAVAAKEQQLQKTITQLQISEEQKASLHRQFQELRGPQVDLEKLFSSNIGVTGSFEAALRELKLAEKVMVSRPSVPGVCRRCGDAFSLAMFSGELCAKCRAA